MTSSTRDTRGELDEHEPVVGHVDDGEVGDDAVDDAPAGERQRAFVDDLGRAVLGDVLHQHDDLAAPCTRSIAPPGPFTIFPGIIQFARSPVADTCIAPRIAASILPPRIMPKLVAESKNAAPGEGRHGLLAGVDQVGIDVLLGRVRADAEDAVLGLQHDGDAVGHVVRARASAGRCRG